MGFPQIGAAYSLRVDAHCALCFSLRNSAVSTLTASVAYSPNVFAR